MSLHTVLRVVLQEMSWGHSNLKGSSSQDQEKDQDISYPFYCVEVEILPPNGGARGMNWGRFSILILTLES